MLSHRCLKNRYFLQLLLLLIVRRLERQFFGRGSEVHCALFGDNRIAKFFLQLSSVRRSLPSGAVIFSCTILSYNFCIFQANQYVKGRLGQLCCWFPGVGLVLFSTQLFPFILCYHACGEQEATEDTK